MISTTSSSISYTGNASSVTAYAIPFPFVDVTHITASVTNSAGTVSTLTYGTDYTVTGTTDSQGRITGGSLVTTSAIAGTSTVTIRRVTPATQTADFVDGGRISAEALESALDKAVMIAQEAVRDSLGGGETNVEASGTGLVAQTSAGVFATRTISVAAASGLSVTNGDGVSGNPTIDLDNTVLDAVTSAASTDVVRLETASGSKKITVPNLLLQTEYPVREIPISAWEVSGGSSGVSLSAQYAAFTGSASGGVLMNFICPDDMVTSAAIKVKVHAFLFGGTNEQYRLTLAAYLNNEGSHTLGSIVSSVVAQNLTHSSSDGRTSAFSLSGLEAGKRYALLLSRDSGNAWDTASSLTARVSACWYRYSRNPQAANW